MMSVEDRYKTDAAFHSLVDYMVSMIERCRFTPTEIREAAMLAAIISDRRNIRPRRCMGCDAVITDVGLYYVTVMGHDYCSQCVTPAGLSR